METWQERLKRVLPHSEEPELVVYTAASEKDVAVLAQAYLTDGPISAILREAGTHRFLCKQQSQTIAAFNRTSWGGRDPKLSDIAQALARRIAAGEIESASSPKAAEFIRDRFMARENSRSPMVPVHSESFYATAAELLDAARFFLAQDRYRTLFFAPRGSQQTDDDIRYMFNIDANYVSTQGLHCRGTGISGAMIILNALRTGELHSLDGAAALDFARSEGATFSRETMAASKMSAKKNVSER